MTDLRSVPGYVLDEVEQVERLTAKPLLLARDRAVRPAALRIAGPDDPAHVLAYHPGYEAHLHHLVLSAAARTRRVTEADPEIRRAALCGRSNRLPPRLEGELAGHYGLTGDCLLEASNRAYGDTLGLLCVVPVDLRVEAELHDRYEQHRPRHDAYLRRRLLDLDLRSLADPWAGPPGLDRVRAAMGSALRYGFASLAGVPRPAGDLADPGALLYRELRQVEQPGLAGDRAAIDRWARELGIEDWYQWRPVP